MLGHAAHIEPTLPTPEDTVRFAVWLHLELIRIHPFFDGNGRTSRLLCNIVLQRRIGAPIAIEAVKQDYLESANSYFSKTPMPNIDWQHGALTPMIDLYLECLELQVREGG